VPYAFTVTEFGGRRAWFRCPGCKNGCRILYGTHSLRCRNCLGLKYQSQYDQPAFRMLERARKIRRRLERLGGRLGDAGGPFAKPRYMHWRRYRSIEQLVFRLESAGWAALSAHTIEMSRKLTLRSERRARTRWSRPG